MNEKDNYPVQSAINRILQSEETIQLRITEAHNQAEARIVTAHEEAAYIRKAAEQQGLKLHNEQYQNTLAAARQDADLIVAQAQSVALELTKRSKEKMPAIVEWIIDVIADSGGNSPL